MSAISPPTLISDEISSIVGGSNTPFRPFALPRGEFIGIKVHGVTILFENEAKKSSRLVTLGTNGDKCVICLTPFVCMRESIAAYFLNCVNCEASGVGIILNVQFIGASSVNLQLQHNA
jgi:hypothetical protein